MNKEFVSYGLALRMKELGFNEPCFAIYGKSEGNLFKVHTDKFDTVDELHFIKAPTYSQCFRWFREKYDMIHNIDRIFKDEFGYIITPGDKQPINAFNFNSYEEAELACLENLIEIVESKSE